jgi:Fe2+ transport system protein FeoA
VAKLNELRPGQRARVVSVRNDNNTIYQRLLEMGLFDGVEVDLVRYAPLGDPLEITLHGYNLSLRKAEAAMVDVEVLS